VRAVSDMYNRAEEDELERDPDLPRPRLSMPIDAEEDDDSFHLPPTLVSAPLEDDAYTQRSVEVPRRAISEQPFGRLSRGSFGSVRTSDRFADTVELGLDAMMNDGPIEDSMIGPDPDYEFDDRAKPEDEIDHGYECYSLSVIPSVSVTLTKSSPDTQDLGRAILEDSARRRSRPSNIRPRHTVDEDDTTFAFNIPQVVSREASSPDVHIDLNTREVPSRPGIGGDVAQKEPRHKGAGSQIRDSKVQKLSRHGIAYPSLPAGVVKKVASSFARLSGNSKGKLDREALGAIMQASDWYLEQLADDLGTYAKHAGRKTIDETDVVTLMKRQRQLNAATTPFSLAQKYLPRELLQDIHMAPQPKSRHPRRRRLETVDEEDEDEAS